MPINWDATGSMLSGWGAIGGAAAVAYAAYRAANTIDGWKRQRIAERRFDHAERTLAATYKVREAIEIIRSAGIHHYELDKAQAEIEADPNWNPLVPRDRKKRLYHAQVYVARIRSTEEAWDELQASLPLAKALFDDRLERALTELLRVRWLIRLSADAFVDIDDHVDRDFARKTRAQLCSRLEDGKDEISTIAREQIEVIEATCLPILRGD